MRDFLPEETRRRRALGRGVLGQVELFGYALVTPPAFEFAEVLERGLGTLDPSEVLRFVEPDSGEVAALRPDMTPQVARMIATRLFRRPPPYRLAYEGTVLRRRGGRARTHRQIPQVGVELAGVPGPAGDLELLAVAAEALRAAGLGRFTLDLGDAGIARGLLAEASPEAAQAISEAMARKDEEEVAERARAAGVDDTRLRALLALAGGEEALAEGARLLAGTPAAAALARLESLYRAARAEGLADVLAVDLGEVRSYAYYTGMLFRAYAPGPGSPVGSGGRYDELLSRFGAPMPAVGFALDLDCLAVAVVTAGVAPDDPPGVVVTGAGARARATSLRQAGVAAVVLEEATALDYARAWGYSHVLGASELVDVATGAAVAATEAAVEGLRALGRKERK